MSEQIGVLVSIGYGAGWSTWGDTKSCLDQELVAAFKRGASEAEISAIAEKNWPEQYQGGLMDCTVEYLDKGILFRINEYDGAESLELMSQANFIVAE